ncbi:MAG: arginase family protein [Acidobacteriota bacterium]
MRIVLIAVPYDAGRRRVGVGMGPGRLIDAGLANQLRDDGYDVREVTLEMPPSTSPHEMARVVAMQREVAHAVREALDGDELPIVLAGNCSVAVGALAGRPDDIAVLWFDAHADFNTADTTVSGMLDGMALSMVTGRALSGLTASVEGFSPVDDGRVVLVGARDLDPAEHAALERSRIQRIGSQHTAVQTCEALRALGRPLPPVYLHLDLDVIDPAHARANQFAAPDGLTPQTLLSTLAGVANLVRLHAVAVTAYDPAWDEDGRARQAALDAIGAIAPRLTTSE